MLVFVEDIIVGISVQSSTSARYIAYLSAWWTAMKGLYR
jgi:hypothetical protein